MEIKVKEVKKAIAYEINKSNSFYPEEWSVYSNFDKESALDDISKVLQELDVQMYFEIRPLPLFFYTKDIAVCGKALGDIIKRIYCNLGYSVTDENNSIIIDIVKSELWLVDEYEDLTSATIELDGLSADSDELMWLSETQEYKRYYDDGYDFIGQEFYSQNMEDCALLGVFCSGSLHYLYVDTFFRHMGFQKLFFELLPIRLYLTMNHILRCLSTHVVPYSCPWVTSKEHNASDEEKKQMELIMKAALFSLGFKRIEDSDFYIKDFLEKYLG